MIKQAAPGIYRLALIQMVNVYLIEIDEGWMLVDTGHPGQERRLLRGIAKLSSQRGPLRHVVITHGHSDHIGNAAAVREATGATLWIHPADAPALVTGVGNQALMPEGAASGPFMSGGVRPAPADGELADGLALPFAPEWQVYHVPGHTPGQCCFYDAGRRVLIVGDSLMHWLGRLSEPFRAATVDPKQNLAGVRRLAQLDIEWVLFGHGPPLHQPAGAALRAWLADRDS